jgi:Family of unknown function (DUF6521)
MVFLVPPLVLHRPTREALPRNTRTHLSTWITRHALLRAGFPRRAAAMTHLSKEGFRMGLRTGGLALDGGGLHGRATGTAPVGELDELVRAANLVGRWFSRSDQPSTPFILFGVTP